MLGIWCMHELYSFVMSCFLLTGIPHYDIMERKFRQKYKLYRTYMQYNIFYHIDFYLASFIMVTHEKIQKVELNPNQGLVSKVDLVVGLIYLYSSL